MIFVFNIRGFRNDIFTLLISRYFKNNDDQLVGFVYGCTVCVNGRKVDPGNEPVLSVKRTS